MVREFFSMDLLKLTAYPYIQMVPALPPIDVAHKPSLCFKLSPSPDPPPPWPFKSMNVYLVMEWMITGRNQKSMAEVDHLVKKVLSHRAF